MSGRARTLVTVLSSVALGLTVGACSGGGDGGIGVTEADYSIAVDQTDLKAGKVTFDVSNEAEQTHEFVVVRTDLAQDALPTGEDGDVDEEAEGIEPVDEIEDIKAGTSQSLTVNLDPGTYVVICNLPGHYRQGMHEAITVT